MLAWRLYHAAHASRLHTPSGWIWMTCDGSLALRAVLLWVLWHRMHPSNGPSGRSHSPRDGKWWRHGGSCVVRCTTRAHGFPLCAQFAGDVFRWLASGQLAARHTFRIGVDGWLRRGDGRWPCRGALGRATACYSGFPCNMVVTRQPHLWVRRFNTPTTRPINGGPLLTGGEAGIKSPMLPCLPLMAWRGGKWT